MHLYMCLVGLWESYDKYKLAYANLCKYIAQHTQINKYITLPSSLKL